MPDTRTPPDDDAASCSPWHEGELTLQKHAGAVEKMDVLGRKFIRHCLLDQHRAFYPLLPFIVMGAVDGQGTPWATIRCGQPGFMEAPDPLTLNISVIRDPGDPAQNGMMRGEPVGLLGIDLMTRRRNRLNGTLIRNAEQQFSVAVEQSFGNCPRYIQRRNFTFVRDPLEPFVAAAEVSDRLDDDSQQMIAQADTFFVASYADRADAGRQVDVSHRGGQPGFVRLEADGSLTIPDFNGNLFFNTLGNFLINPRAGLLFFNQQTGDVVQIAGRAVVMLDSPEILAFEGAERLWRVIPEKIVLRRNALPLRWSGADDDLSRTV